MRRLIAATVMALLSTMVIAQGDVLEPLAAARNLLGSLKKPQLARARLAFDSDERLNWHYVPRSRRGIPLADLNAGQRQQFQTLLRASTSESGFRKAMDVVELEGVLGIIEGSSFRDPQQYFVSLFGDPGSKPWGWRFEGHHLSLNFSAAGGELAATPIFLGANPSRVRSGPRAGWRVLREEEDLGRELVRSLDSWQREHAVILDRPPQDIVTGAQREVSLKRFDGLPASAMNAAQRALLLQLIRTYVGKASRSVENREMAAFSGTGIERVHFAWAGAVEAGKPHYYRIHGPTILIEYDNTQSGGDHIHSVWRTPGRDFGGDLLRRHYATAAHHSPHSTTRTRPRIGRTPSE